ncbi:MAG: hypothetical protein KDA87_26625, partial [Planctomycetales bacterium]|nr:hypothetical protein [Planctomycetales bacterium]
INSAMLHLNTVADDDTRAFFNRITSLLCISAALGSSWVVAGVILLFKEAPNPFDIHLAYVCLGAGGTHCLLSHVKALQGARVALSLFENSNLSLPIAESKEEKN